MVGQKKLGILFLVSVILAFVAGLYASRVVPAFSPNNPQDVFDYLTEVLEEYYYYDIDDEDKHLAFIASIEASIDTYAKLSNDPYTRLVKVPITNEQSEQVFRGFGMFIDYEGSNLRIINTIYNTPAYMKVYPNDLIIGISIDAEDFLFDQLTIAQVDWYMTAQQSCTKTFIVRDPDFEVRYVEMTCDELYTPSVYGKSLDADDIAYIKIDSFSGETASMFSDILNSYQQTILSTNETPKTLIIDVRNNPGGSVLALHNRGTSLMPGILQQLIPIQGEQVHLFSLVDKYGDQARYDATMYQKKSYDIKILVNENSASASEVLASVMLTSGGYQVYGAPTYGKGVFQNQIEILRAYGYIYYLNYTEGVWLYDIDKNVETDPIPVFPIENTGIKSLEMPVYGGQVSFDQYNMSLANFQHFLNYYFEYEAEDMLRTDGYFDQKTQQALLQFNTLHDRANIDFLDRETAILIYQVYEQHLHDLSKDMQLQHLIHIINEG